MGRCVVVYGEAFSACDFYGRGKGANWVCFHPAEESGSCLQFTFLVRLLSLYLVATWPRTNIRARRKGVTHMISLADRTQSHGNTRMLNKQYCTKLHGAGQNHACVCR